MKNITLGMPKANYMQKTLFIALLLGLTTAAGAKDNHALSSKRAPVSFIENKGQVTDAQLKPRADIQYSVSALPGLHVFIGSGAIHYQFSKIIGSAGDAQGQLLKMKDAPAAAPHRYQLYRMDVTLAGANPNARVLAEGQGNYFERYYKPGTLPAGIVANSYSKITYKDIYPNIDWVLHIANGQLTHEFIVQPGGNAADIHFRYGGATALTRNADGSITASTPLGAITEAAPLCYEATGRAVASNFVLNGNELTYKTAAYSGTLVIDPSLQWSTYFGVNQSEEVAYGVVTDIAGNAYVTGEADIMSGLATAGAYQDSIEGLRAALVAKFTGAGDLVWATYFGGLSFDRTGSIAIDSIANIYIASGAGSDTGIATPGAYQEVKAGNSNTQDLFLAKFNTNGALQWATYFGGWGNEYPGGLAVDPAGNVLLSGTTTTDTGIATAGAYQMHAAGSGPFYHDGFLAKFNGAGALMWSTYFGGPAEDYARNIATDATGNVFMQGITWSTTGIASPGAQQDSLHGYQYNDAFVTKFSPAGTLLWATYFGGNKFDDADGIATDAQGNVLMTGWTTSDSGVATAGAYQASYGGAGSYIQAGDAYLVKYNGAGSLQWATYYGGSRSEYGTCLATDATGNVYMTGATNSHAGIATAGAFLDSCYNTDTTYGLNGFLSEFDATGSLQWATYWGGSHMDQCYGVTLDTAGNIYLTGYTADTTNIATAGAYQSTFGGDADIFLAKFSPDKMASTAISNIMNTSAPVRIYPNPTHSELTITATVPIKQIMITDLLGKTVWSSTYAAPSISLNLEQLTSGVYVLRINGTDKIYKLVKE